jgi:hypothetical protein
MRTEYRDPAILFAWSCCDPAILFAWSCCIYSTMVKDRVLTQSYPQTCTQVDRTCIAGICQSLSAHSDSVISFSPWRILVTSGVLRMDLSLIVAGVSEALGYTASCDQRTRCGSPSSGAWHQELHAPAPTVPPSCPSSRDLHEAIMAIPYTRLFIAPSCNSRSSHGQYTRSSTFYIYTPSSNQTMAASAS